jgi:hypothetical protein
MERQRHEEKTTWRILTHQKINRGNLPKKWPRHLPLAIPLPFPRRLRPWHSLLASLFRCYGLPRTSPSHCSLPGPRLCGYTLAVPSKFLTGSYVTLLTLFSSVLPRALYRRASSLSARAPGRPRFRLPLKTAGLTSSLLPARCRPWPTQHNCPTSAGRRRGLSGVL